MSGERARAEASTETPESGPLVPPSGDEDFLLENDYPDDDHLPAPGELLTPHLRMVRPIASGGMGSVWVAEHLTLRTEVAVKFLRRALVRHPVALTRFQREAAAAAKLRSPHVIQVFDHGCTEEGVPFIVMELLQGETLQERWERKVQFSLEEMAEIVRQAGRALSKAHDLGIVHRDIKPENIFLVSGEVDPFVKVLDFGIAKSVDDSAERVTSFGLVMGTPQFMSPEQMMGDDSVGPASDVWSLGVVAYALLTGRLPYEGSNLAKLAVEIDRGDPPLASEYSKEVTPAIDAWLSKAMCQLASARYPDARALIDALEEALLCPRPENLPELTPAQVRVRETTADSISFTRSGTAYIVRDQPAPRLRGKARWWAAPIAACAMIAGYLCLAPTASRASATPAVPAAKVAEATGADAPKAVVAHTADVNAIEKANAKLLPAQPSSVRPVVAPSTKASTTLPKADPAKSAWPKKRRDLGF